MIEELVLQRGSNKIRATLYGKSLRGILLCPPHPRYGGSRQDLRLVGIANELANSGVSALCLDYSAYTGGTEEIAQKLGMDTERFLGEYVQKDSRSGELLLRRSRNGCAFLCWDQDGRARCDIYPFRPKACRNFVASLSRPECREGLSRLKSGQRLLLPNQLYHSGKAVERLSKAVRETDT
jgi:Fe-S-cluster containining protein